MSEGAESIKVLMGLSDRISKNEEGLKARPTHKDVLEEVGDLRKDLMETRESVRDSVATLDGKIDLTMERLDGVVKNLEEAANTKITPPTWDVISRIAILIIAVIAILLGQFDLAAGLF